MTDEEIQQRLMKNELPPEELGAEIVARLAHLPPDQQREFLEVWLNVIRAQSVGHIPIGLSARMRDLVGYTWASWLQVWKEKAR